MISVSSCLYTFLFVFINEINTTFKFLHIHRHQWSKHQEQAQFFFQDSLHSCVAYLRFSQAHLTRVLNRILCICCRFCDCILGIKLALCSELLDYEHDAPDACRTHFNSKYSSTITHLTHCVNEVKENLQF